MIGAEHGAHAGGHEDDLRLWRVMRMPGRATAGQLGRQHRDDVLADDLAGHAQDAAHRGVRHMVDHGHADRRHVHERTPDLRGTLPGGVQPTRSEFGAHIADQLTGVDLHRAGGLAHAVDRAGIDHRVALVFLQLGDQSLVVLLLGMGDGPLDDDPLPRGGGQMLAGTDRLAVAAFHAVIDDRTHRRGLLDVDQVQLRVLGQHRIGVEDPGGITGLLDLPHGVVELVTVLPVDERGHDASGAVLGLQRALLAEHQGDHVLGEVLVALHGRRPVEILGDQEVDVAVLGMPEDDTAFVAMAVEEHLQIAADRAEIHDRHRDVLEQRGRALRTIARDLGVQALAQRPHLFAASGVLGQFRRGVQIERRALFHAGPGPGSQLVVRVALILDQQDRFAADGEVLRQHRSSLGAHREDGRRVDQLGHVGPAVDDRGQRFGGCVEGVEEQETGGGLRMDRDGLQGRLGNEAQRALTADHQVLEDLDRIVEIDERVQAVAHGVLHGVAALQVGTHLGATQLRVQLGQHLDQLRLLVGEHFTGLGAGGVDDGSRGQRDHHRVDRAVGVGGGSAGHAGRVVGDHAADGAGDLAGRIGAELGVVLGQPGIHLPDRRSGLDAHPLTGVQNLDIAEMPPDVERQSARERLARQAGAAAAECQRPTRAHGQCHGHAHLVGSARTGQSLRNREIVGRIDRDREAVESAGCDFNIFAQCGREFADVFFGHIGQLCSGTDY